MASTTDFSDFCEGTLIAKLDTSTTSGVQVKAQSVNGSPITWPTGAHRIIIIEETTTTKKIEKINVASGTTQSTSTVSLGTLTRALSFTDGSDFSGGDETAQTFGAGARVLVSWDTHAAEQTPFKDTANTFTANQLINGTNQLQLNDTATYLYDDGTDLIFKDSQNSETTLSTLAASGNDEKVGVDSGATPDYLGAASNDGVLRTGDGLSYTDGGNFVTLDVTMIKDASATELTIATGSITRTGSAHTVDTESDAASDDLDTIAGGTDGDYITIRANNDARTVVVKHGTGNIITTDNSDFSIDTDDKSITFRYDGTNWREVCRAAGSGGEANNKKIFLHVSEAAVGSAAALTGVGDDYGHRAFDPSSNENLAWNFILPDDYTTSATITARPFWATSNTNTGTVEWDFFCDSLADSSALGDAYTQSAVTVTDNGLGTSNDLHVASDSGAITIGGSPSAGDFVKFKVDRDAVSDTYTGDARLIGVQITYS